MLDLAAIRARFPALARTGPDGRPVVHADAPGGTQVVDTAIEAVANHLGDGTANQHGVFPLSAAVDRICDDARAAAARFLGSPQDGIVFGPNMTTLTFHFSRALGSRIREGDTIVCTRLDHDANVSPWLALAERAGAHVRWVGLDPASGTLDMADLERVVTDRTRLVAFPRASNALGTLVDPAPFVAAAQAVGALTFMDAVHAAPHVALDRTAEGVDVVVCSPYKFFGPHAGVLAAPPDLLESLEPDKVRPAPDRGPERWQTGTASFEAMAGTSAAIGYLEEVGFEAIRTHERHLSARFLDAIAALDHVRLHGPSDPDDRTPTFAVTVDGHPTQGVAERLAADGINVWAGHYYAIEPMRALGLLDDGGAVRIGFVHYHGDDDVDRVIATLASLA